MTEKEIEKIYNEGYRAVYWTAMSLLKNEADAEHMTYFVSKKIEGDGTFKLHVEIPLRDPAEKESET